MVGTFRTPSGRMLCTAWGWSPPGCRCPCSTSRLHLTRNKWSRGQLFGDQRRREPRVVVSWSFSRLVSHRDTASTCWTRRARRFSPRVASALRMLFCVKSFSILHGIIFWARIENIFCSAFDRPTLTKLYGYRIKTQRCATSTATTWKKWTRRKIKKFESK